jgi:hypothetical protein
LTKQERKKDRERETSEMKRFIVATVPEHKSNNFYSKKIRSISVFVFVREKESEREREGSFLSPLNFLPVPSQGTLLKVRDLVLPGVRLHRS